MLNAQHAADIKGPVLEIGVFAGKFLMLLHYLGRQHGTITVGVDIFTDSRPEPILRHAEALFGTAAGLSLHEIDSANLTAETALALLGHERPRAISVDGDHTAAGVLRDLRLDCRRTGRAHPRRRPQPIGGRRGGGNVPLSPRAWLPVRPLRAGRQQDLRLPARGARLLPPGRAQFFPGLCRSGDRQAVHAPAVGRHTLGRAGSPRGENPDLRLTWGSKQPARGWRRWRFPDAWRLRRAPAGLGTRVTR